MSFPVIRQNKQLMIPANAHLLADARAAIDAEDYDRAIDVGLLTIQDTTTSPTDFMVPLVDVALILAWAYALSRRFDEFEELVVEMATHGISYESCPQLEHAFLHTKLVHSSCDEVLAICDSRVLEYKNRAEVSLENLAGYLWARGKANANLGRLSAALEDCESAFGIWSVLEHGHNLVRTSGFLGVVYRALSDYRESLKWSRRAESRARQLGLLRKLSTILLNTGVTNYKVADYAASRAALEESFQIGLDNNWPHRQCFANIALGNVCRLTRDFDAARRHLHTAYNQAQELEYPREEALALEFLGDVYRDEGQPAAARRFYVRALAIAERLAPEGDIVMEVHRRVGECLALEGDAAAARPELDRALALARAQGDRFEEAVTLRVLAETVDALDDHAAAREHIAASVGILREIGARHEAAISLLKAAHLHLDASERERPAAARTALDAAWSHATAALDLFIQVDVAWWTEQARALVDRIGRRRAAADKAEAETGASYAPGHVIVHASRAMKDALELTDMFAASHEPVLITGETGTGKELIAQRVHARSGRTGGQLVTVNVAAIAATVFEREFFGHVRGAFSGADRDQPGYAALADGGTLFLDEIGELPLDMQPKLLRLLQDGGYQAVGDPRPRRADVRLVAATNADLATLVAEGRFRADLWYRLRILELHLPPVRDRAHDVRPLLRHFLSLAAGRATDPAEVFDAPSLAAAEAWSWPGNVREIAMVARRALVEQRTRGQFAITLRDGPRAVMLSGGAPRAALVARAAEGDGDADADDRARITAALDHCAGSRQEAARLLGLSRSTLYRRMEKLGIREGK